MTRVFEQQNQFHPVPTRTNKTVSTGRNTVEEFEDDDDDDVVLLYI